MREAEFRAWLGERRWKGEPLQKKAKDNRVRRSGRAERGLQGLGFAETTLEAVFAEGQWDTFLARLNELKAPGADPVAVKSVVPQAAEPSGQLTNMIAALKQYGYFLEGRDPNYGAVQGDVADDEDDTALYLVTNLYGSSDGFDRFIERKEWTLLDDRGSKLNQLVCEIQPGDIVALRDFLPNRRDLPFDAQGHLVSAMRFRAIGTVTGQRGDGIGVDVDWTVLPEPRTWYFYTRNRAVWRPPVDSEAAVRLRGFLLDNTPQDYDWFIAQWWPENATLKLDTKALAALRERFLEKQPGFRTFATSASFEAGEGGGKRALIARTRELLDDPGLADESALGSALLDLVMGKGGIKSDLLSWRMIEGLAGYLQARPGEIELAVADLVRSNSPLQGIEAFVETAWPIMAAGQEKSLPYQDSRAIPTTLGALVWPEQVIGIGYTTFLNAGTMLLGRSLYANAPLSSKELRDTLALAEALFRVMRDDWGWEPRDYWDVRGFIWETCQTRLKTSDDTQDEQTELLERPVTPPTNLILYGPPGTGKTYATAREAVVLCDGLAPEDRGALMERYGELVQAGRIGFVTFHQSFSYEDFVEGLRPVPIESEDGASSGFQLKPEDGVFMRMADVAASNKGKTINAPSVPLDRGRKAFKMSLGRAGIEEQVYQDAISGGYVVLGWGGEVDWSDPRFDHWEAIKERWREDHPEAGGNDPNMSQMYTFRISMQIGSLVVISDGNRKFRAIGEITGPYQFVPGPDGEYNHRRSVRWLWQTEQSLPRELIYDKELSQVSTYQLNSRNIKWEGLEQIVSSGGESGSTAGPPEPHVLIIDEINRANISKVFGELITLIEPDKRLGMANALTVRLPYSKREFGVPANLHLIGTMNTADRSIALLDTALRRRFRFEEIAPRPELLGDNVGGVPLRRVLTAINQRIEYLLDRDHRIGHAFFMGERAQARAGIDAVMRDKVIPLLQEYFFEDWSRIAAVVGRGFIGETALQPPPGLEGLDPKPSWFVRPVFPVNAYDILLGKAPAPSDEAEADTDAFDEGEGEREAAE